MNISYGWLRDIAPGIADEPEALAERLGMLGAPVEELVRPGAGLGDIVVARVLRAGRHPNADRLSLCEVDAGDGEPLQVVCGAPNVEEGALYPFAPVGSTLPGGMQIRKAKIRGEYSNGMLCSERELGLGRSHEGIMKLAGAYRVGAPLVDALGLDDARLTLEVTPNRPDLLSHVGVARELAPDGHHGIDLPPFPAPDSDEVTDATMPPISFRREEREGSIGGVSVRVEDATGCPRYVAALVEDVTIGPSPAWLAARLRSIGLRPINNVVDATNYVLHELGQPLHAFDADRLSGPAIVVRRAAEGEPLVTLDDVERTLDPSMVVIADAERPTAIAGVMGGADSEVTAGTARILLECAYFDPPTVRATARDLGMSTDASYRFERGVDIEGMERAVHRALELIQAVAGGRIGEEAVDIYPAALDAPEVSVRPSRVARLVGEPIAASEVEELLEHIGFELRERADDSLTFRVPGFRRHDVTREVDLIEEVARRYGYDRLGDELRPYRPNTVPDAPMSGLEDRLRDALVGRGLLEAKSVPMAPEGAGQVALLRPLSAEEGRLRSTLVFGLLRALELNLARGIRDVRLFEIGTTFHAPGSGELPDEQTRVALVVTGDRRPRHWSGESPAWDVWDVKALAGDVARTAGLDDRAIGPLPDDPGTIALPGLYREGTVLGVRAGGELVGVVGQVADGAIDAPAWAAPVFAAELRLTPEMATRHRPRLRPLPTQPASDRDLALLVPTDVAAADVESAITGAAGPLLEDVWPFDLYTGPGVTENIRSIAYRLVFRDPERTLTDQEVDAAVERILERLQKAHGVERRG